MGGNGRWMMGGTGWVGSYGSQWEMDDGRHWLGG